MFDEFYHNIIRKYVIIFGTLFNDIHITRQDKDGDDVMKMKVPITYGPRDKMLARAMQDPDLDRPSATVVLPMMSFEMTEFQYDAARKLSSMNFMCAVNPNDPDSKNYMYSPIPYNIGFRLSILVKNSEDGTKIIEQILPYFSPQFTVKAELIPEMNSLLDIPVFINSVNLDDEYEDDFRIRRTMIWTLDFTMKGYFFGPVKSSKVIKFVDVNLYSTQANPITDTVGNTPVTATIHVQPGLTANGEPTSNSALSIPVDQILATDDFGYCVTITEY